MEQEKTETPFFWLISQQAHVELMQYKWQKYGLKLDIPPRPLPPPYAVQPRTDMTEEELGKFMRQPPSRREKVE